MLYLDSSALIKYYIQEPGTNAIHAKIKEEAQQPGGIFVSVLGYAEILATFARRGQTNLLQERFKIDWAFELTQIELNSSVLLFIPKLVNNFPLKGSDAIQLASALWLRDSLRLGLDFGHTNRRLTFATSDKQLKSAALAEGLELFDPEIVT